MHHPARHEIEKHAKDEYAVAQERIAVKQAEEQRRVLVQVARRGNIGGYAPALTELKARHARQHVIALANAYAKTFTFFGVPCDVEAERSLEAGAWQIAAGLISAVRGELDLIQGRIRSPLHNTGGVHREIERSTRSAINAGKLRLRRQRIKFRNSGSPLQMGPPSGSAESPDSAKPLVRSCLEDARSKVRAVAKSLASGSQTLDQAAAALELEAKIWGQYLHHAILEEAALEGVPPEQFDKRASESGDEIALMAANEFAVQCGRDTTNGVTPILIGHISAVINSDEPPEINTWGSIVQCLKKVLADYPQEYRRQNLSVYKLTRGAESIADELSAPPARMTTNSPQGIGEGPIKDDRAGQAEANSPEGSSVEDGGFFKRLSKDDPNYEVAEVAERLYLKALADSHGLKADARAGKLTLSDFIEGWVEYFRKAVEATLVFEDATPLLARRDELEGMAKSFIDKFTAKVLSSPESEHLDQATVTAVIAEFSDRVNDIADRTAQRIIEAELARRAADRENQEPVNAERAAAEAKTTAVTPAAPAGAPSPQQEPVGSPESPKVTPDRDERSATYQRYVRACKERSVKMTEARLANLANRNWSTRDPVAKWKQLKDRPGDDALIRAAIRKGPPKA